MGDPAAGVAHDVLTNVAGNEPAAAHMPTGPLTWSKDAQAELDRAPFFVKGPAKDGAEKYLDRSAPARSHWTSSMRLGATSQTLRLHEKLLVGATAAKPPMLRSRPSFCRGPPTETGAW